MPIQETTLDNERAKDGGSHAGELAARLRSAHRRYTHRRAVGRGPLRGRGPRRRQAREITVREASAPDVGRVVEERAAVGRKLDIVQVVRRRWPGILRRAEHKRLLGLVIIVVWQRERMVRAAVDKTVQFVVRVRVERRRLRLRLQRELRPTCKTREPRSAPARRRRGVRKVRKIGSFLLL